uniref:Uncharacterized protein n=1 Tax=Parascaris equorum TaxID=6256 RepID=A0A914RTY4_PAREQ
MDSSGRIKVFRFVAYSAVIFSLVSIFAICISLPTVDSHVNNTMTPGALGETGTSALSKPPTLQ